MDKKKVWNSSQFIYMAMSLSTVLVLFGNYIIGQKFIIPKDWTSDAIQNIWPNLLYLSRQIKDGSISAWNFANGLGTKGTHYHLGDFFATALGYNNIPYFLNLLYATKIIIGGLFFYKYIKLATKNDYAAVISGFSYAFCSHMMLRGIWRGYPNEVMLVAIMLYASEKFVIGEWHKRFPLIVAIFSWTVEPYYACFYLVIFISYAFYRYFYKNWNVAALKKFSEYTGAYIIGFLLNIYNIFNFVYDSLMSGRFAFIDSKEDISWFSLADIPLDFVGSIAPTLFGTENRTYTNILEGPEFYCGILTVLLITQVLCLKDKVQKYWFLGMLSLVGVYCVCPWIRMVASAGGRTAMYKVSAFWIILILLTIISNLWKHFEENGINKVVFNVTCLFVGIGYILCRVFLFVLPINCYDIGTLVLIILYCVLFNLYSVAKISWVKLKRIILCLAMCEVIFLFYGMYNCWDVLTVDDLSADIFYNYTDNSKNKIIQKINEKDDDEFYRMEQVNLSTYPCDPLAYGYYGVSNYTGGIINSKYLVGFMRSVSEDNAETVTLLRSFGNDVALNTLVGVKYILSSCDSGMYGYSYLEQIGDVQVYKNENALSLGYTYDTFMDYDTFIEIPIENRGVALLDGCVLEAEELKQYVKKMDSDIYNEVEGFNAALYEKNVEERKKELLHIEEFEEDYIKGTIETQGDRILFFSIPYDVGWKIRIDDKEEELYNINNGLLGTHIAEGNHSIELRYVNPVWKYSRIVIGIGFIFYTAYVVQSKRKMKQSLDINSICKTHMNKEV